MGTIWTIVTLPYASRQRSTTRSQVNRSSTVRRAPAERRAQRSGVLPQPLEDGLADRLRLVGRHQEAVHLRLTISGSEAASEAITGQPRAMASTRARPNSSLAPAEPARVDRRGVDEGHGPPQPGDDLLVRQSAPRKRTSLPGASSRSRSEVGRVRRRADHLQRHPRRQPFDQEVNPLVRQHPAEEDDRAVVRRLRPHRIPLRGPPRPRSPGGAGSAPGQRPRGVLRDAAGAPRSSATGVDLVARRPAAAAQVRRRRRGSPAGGRTGRPGTWGATKNWWQWITSAPRKLARKSRGENGVMRSARPALQDHPLVARLRTFAAGPRRRSSPA